MDLTGKRALVCGASQGIGAATARALADCGASVTLVARRESALREVLDALLRNRGQAHALVPTDLGDPGGLERLAAHIGARGPFHILVNNSGGPPAGALCQADPNAFEQGFRQHVLAAQTLLIAALPGMRKSSYGRIINIISTSVKMPIPNLGVSNTIRGAMANWSKTLAGELGADGITVNNVLPGATDTPRLAGLIATGAKKSGQSEAEVAAALRARIPLGRFAQPEETAAAVAFLASPLAAYISGINLPVDGGRTGCL